MKMSEIAIEVLNLIFSSFNRSLLSGIGRNTFKKDNNVPSIHWIYAERLSGCPDMGYVLDSSGCGASKSHANCHKFLSNSIRDTTRAGENNSC